MLFNSSAFLIFFPVVTLLFFLLPHKFRWVLLLFASCFFYMFFKPEYIIILAFTIVVDYYAGILIEKQGTHKNRRLFLLMSIIANVGVLAVFKYYNFLNTNITGLATHFGFKNNMPILRMALPIGLSFHTFQAMSYTIEIFRGNQKAEKHFGIYALYVMFYPQLVAGPIERPQNMIHQFYEKKQFNYHNTVSGLRLMMWGMFKKAVIADRLAYITDPVYNNPHAYSGTAMIIAAFFFGFQIFCDFSGYSDIAIGSARVMGYTLMVNFDHPFSSRSITEFWRRWHISLSTWFFDYVFNPMITTLRNWGKAAIALGLFVTFFLSGIWHGAGWKFIIFGVLHGLAMIYEFYTRKQRKKLFKKLPKWLNNLVSQTLVLFYATFTWIFFRANSTYDAFYIIRTIGAELRSYIKGFVPYISHAISTALGSINISAGKLAFYILLIAAAEVITAMHSRGALLPKFEKQNRIVRWGIYYVCVLSIIYMGVFSNRQFIYFQF